LPGRAAERITQAPSSSSLGALIWTVGSFMLANEPEGDIEHDRHDHDRHDRHDSKTDSGRGGAGN